jgi:hypothetical protein
MALDREQADGVASASRCGSYRFGHDIHPTQARLSVQNEPGDAYTVATVADDGTVTFTDGVTRWNHDPSALRAVLARCGDDVWLRDPGVLAIPEGEWTRCFSVAEAPDPCRPETAEVRPGESILDELIRRGGVLRRIDDVKSEIDRLRESPRDDAVE